MSEINKNEKVKENSAEKAADTVVEKNADGKLSAVKNTPAEKSVKPKADKPDKAGESAKTKTAAKSGKVLAKAEKPEKSAKKEPVDKTGKPVAENALDKTGKTEVKKVRAAAKPNAKYDAELAESKALADAIAKTLVAKKAYNVVGIKVDHLTTLADYFIIAGAKSTTAVRALGNAVDEMTSKELGIEVRHREGVREGRWIAMDYGVVILHIFLEEAREFYQLERLWVDGVNTVNYD